MDNYGDDITKMLDSIILDHEKIDRKGYIPTSRAVCKQGSKNTGHDDFPPSTMETGSPDVWVNSVPISRQTDVWKPHGNMFTQHQAVNWEASETVFVNQLAVARVGDRVTFSGSYSETDISPTAIKPDEDKDDLIYVDTSLTYKKDYGVEDYTKQPICLIGLGAPTCNSIIKTGSEDVYCGSTQDSEIQGYRFEDDPTSVGWGCKYPRER